MITRKRRFRIEILAIMSLMISLVFSIVIGYVFLGSHEAYLNITVSSLESEIEELKTEIDGLDMQKQELVSFNRIEELAVEKGYTYKNSSSAALAVGVKRD